MNRPEPNLTPEIDHLAIDRLFDIAGQRVFIPGGYGAIGEATAIAMARRGAAVAIAGRSGARAQALAERINAAGGRAVGFELDARHVGQIAEVAAKVVEEFGGIDGLVN